MKPYYITNTKDFQDYLHYRGYELLDINTFKYRQIRNCQAWELSAKIKHNDSNQVYTIPILQSYKTIVAYALYGEVWTWKKYSPTTSRQITFWKRGD